MDRIIHVVTVRRPRPEVFRAVSTGDGLAAWWTKKVRGKQEPRVGDEMDLTFVPDFNPTLMLDVIDQPTMVRWVCVAGHRPWSDSALEFRLEEVARGTRLLFVQTFATRLDHLEYGTYNFNWGFYLESLRLCCQQGKGKPFDPARGRCD